MGKKSARNTMMCGLLPQSLNYTSVFHTGWDSSFKMRECFLSSINLALEKSIQNSFTHRCLTRCSLIILATLKNLLVHFSLSENQKLKETWNFPRMCVWNRTSFKRSGLMTQLMNNCLCISKFLCKIFKHKTMLSNIEVVGSCWNQTDPL